MEKKPKASIFVAFTPLKMVSCSTNLYSVCDTCDSKKSTSLLEGAPIRVCTSEERSSASLIHLNFWHHPWGTNYDFTKPFYIAEMIHRYSKQVGF